MAKNTNTSRSRTASSLPDWFLLSAAVLVFLLFLWLLWTIFNPTSNPRPSFSTTAFPNQKSYLFHYSNTSTTSCTDTVTPDLSYDPPDPNFYDDPQLSYTIEKPPLKNWNEKRSDWLKQHPSFAAGATNRILIVSGSQPTPCKNQVGDYLLLKLFKNKVDYARRHDGIDVFYNNVLFQPQMFSFWAKTPTVKAAMLAHPEVEWIWWIDSDAVFTDMDFKLPLEKYKDHNMVIHGWPDIIYEKKSWTSINAGVFLIRNCQWSMDFLDVWAQMGPQSSSYEQWGEIQRKTFKDKEFAESDDQSGLVYLLLNEKEKFGNQIYLENGYYFEGYWMEIVDALDGVADKYLEVEKKVGAALRRRHAEKVSESYASVWEDHLKDAGYGLGSWRRPFITHFTGCQPCSGNHNKLYDPQKCVDSMQKALLFADNQVLRNYGFMHPDLLDPSLVIPLPFVYPPA